MESREYTQEPADDDQGESTGGELALDCFRRHLVAGDFNGARKMIEAPGTEVDCLDRGLVDSLHRRLGLDPFAAGVWVTCLIVLIVVGALTLFH